MRTMGQQSPGPQPPTAESKYIFLHLLLSSLHSPSCVVPTLTTCNCRKSYSPCFLLGFPYTDKLQFINSLSASCLKKEACFPWNCYAASYGWVCCMSARAPSIKSWGIHSGICQLRDAASDSCSVKVHSTFSLVLRWPGHNPSLSCPSLFMEIVPVMFEVEVGPLSATLIQFKI